MPIDYNFIVHIPTIGEDMNYVILTGFICAAIIGWIDGGQKMKQARNDPKIGIPPSNSLFTFLFLDRQ